MPSRVRLTGLCVCVLTTAVVFAAVGTPCFAAVPTPELLVDGATGSAAWTDAHVDADPSVGAQLLGCPLGLNSTMLLRANNYAALCRDNALHAGSLVLQCVRVGNATANNGLFERIILPADADMVCPASGRRFSCDHTYELQEVKDALHAEDWAQDALEAFCSRWTREHSKDLLNAANAQVGLVLVDEKINLIKKTVLMNQTIHDGIYDPNTLLASVEYFIQVTYRRKQVVREVSAVFDRFFETAVKNDPLVSEETRKQIEFEISAIQKELKARIKIAVQNEFEKRIQEAISQAQHQLTLQD